jgi:hypothetical protein
MLIKLGWPYAAILNLSGYALGRIASCQLEFRGDVGRARLFAERCRDVPVTVILSLRGRSRMARPAGIDAREFFLAAPQYFRERSISMP